MNDPKCNDDALIADANLAEIARLQSDFTDLRGHLEQMRKALEAERGARKQAEGDTAAYRRILDVLSRAGDLLSMRAVASHALVQFRPPAQHCWPSWSRRANSKIGRANGSAITSSRAK